MRAICLGLLVLSLSQNLIADELLQCSGPMSFLSSSPREKIVGVGKVAEAYNANLTRYTRASKNSPLGPKAHIFSELIKNPANESALGFYDSDKVAYISLVTGMYDEKPKQEFIIDFSQASFEGIANFYERERLRAISEAKSQPTHENTHTSDAAKAHIKAENDENVALDPDFQIARPAHQILIFRGLYLTGEDAAAAYNAFMGSLKTETPPTTVETLPDGSTRSTIIFKNIALVGISTNSGVSYTVDLRGVSNPQDIVDFLHLIAKQTSVTDISVNRVVRKISSYALPWVRELAKKALKEDTPEEAQAKKEKIEQSRLALIQAHKEKITKDLAEIAEKNLRAVLTPLVKQNNKIHSDFKVTLALKAQSKNAKLLRDKQLKALQKAADKLRVEARIKSENERLKLIRESRKSALGKTQVGNQGPAANDPYPQSSTGASESESSN